MSSGHCTGRVRVRGSVPHNTHSTPHGRRGAQAERPDGDGHATGTAGTAAHFNSQTQGQNVQTWRTTGCCQPTVLPAFPGPGAASAAPCPTAGPRAGPGPGAGGGGCPGSENRPQLRKRIQISALRSQRSPAGSEQQNIPERLPAAGRHRRTPE